MSLLTADQLEDVAVYSTDRLRMTFLPELNRCFKEYEINTPKRMAAFLAQAIHESSSFTRMSEIASGRDYEHRKDLGNLEKWALEAAHKQGGTTGRFYKGHGIFQITGAYNHRKYGERLKIDLVNNPTLLCEPEYAVESACMYWNDHELSTYADAGNFNKTTRLINGGYNGKPERDQIYALAKKVFKI